MRLCRPAFLFLTAFGAAVGAAACNLSPGYDLPSAGGKDDGDSEVDVGGDGDESFPGADCANGGAGGEGGSCSALESAGDVKSN